MAATPTAVLLDAPAYSRWSTPDTVLAHVTFTGAAAGNQLVVTARSSTWGALSAQTVTLSSPEAARGWVDVRFPVSSLVDAAGIARLRQGVFVRASAGMTNVDSAVASVLAVSPSELRDGLFLGVPLMASETLGPERPRPSPGIEIVRVAPEHGRGALPLAVTQPGGRFSLRWSDGPVRDVQDTPWNGSVRLYAADPVDWIVVRLRVNELVVGTETVNIEPGEITDERIAALIAAAEAYVENRITCPLSPTTVVTRQLLERSGPYTYDRIGVALPWNRNDQGGRLLALTLPTPRIITLHELTGFLGTQRALEIPQSWFDISHISGHIELIPAYGATIGINNPLLLAGTPGLPQLPSFWQYHVTHGLADLSKGAPAVAREAVLKRAAVELGRLAGFVHKPGYASEQLQRDGVMASINWADGPGGVYAQFLMPHVEWLEQYLERGKLRSRLIGPRVTVL